MEQLEPISCPNCGDDRSKHWATENGFHAVKCVNCGLIYVTPRPALDTITDANRTGVHKGELSSINVRTRRKFGKVQHYKNIIQHMYQREFSSNTLLHWLDVGAGYGEVVEAVLKIAPRGSIVEGIDPMTAKVASAQSRGLAVTTRRFDDLSGPFDVISLINVYSHIPDFMEFGRSLVSKLKVGGSLFIETGNAAELKSAEDYPDTLDLPDHLVFTGVPQMQTTLGRLGLELERHEAFAVDTPLWCLKAAVKSMRRGRIRVRLPGRSPFRTLFFKARKIR